MKRFAFILPIAALMAASSLAAQELPKKEYPSPNAIVDAAPASDWKTISASDLLVMDLAPDAKGEARRVTIQLMPPPFSPRVDRQYPQTSRREILGWDQHQPGAG